VVGERDSIVIDDQDPDDFRLFLDWVYPFDAKDVDSSVVGDRILQISDLYECDHFRAIVRDSLSNWPPSLDLLTSALKYKLDHDLACKAIVWFVKQPALFADAGSSFYIGRD
jgi:hypothetical protein